MKLSDDLKTDRIYYLPLLLVISVASHVPFVLKGFGELDATRIAVSVIDITNHGSDAAFANFYFTDVVPLYILYLSWFMKLLNYNYPYLPLVMNYTNAVIGTLAIIPAFLLIKRVWGNSTIAFCSVLALIFAPSFYQATITGFPHLLAFFFLLMSLHIYILGLDYKKKNMVYPMMILAFIFLTTAFLFKSDFVLASGIYIGLLFIRKESDRGTIVMTFIMIIMSGLLFLLLRNLILGSSGGATNSVTGFLGWFDVFFTIPNNMAYIQSQAKPVVYGAGVLTSFLWITSFVFYVVKRRISILAFFLSWVFIPTIVWLLFIDGNNARHNMLTILPMLVIIIILFYEKARRFTFLLTALLILGNFFVTSPSASILRPSGNLLKSNALLKDKMVRFHSSARQIANINEDKIAVVGYFHNPHVIFEILASAHDYEAFKIGREDYRIKTRDKEYVFIYLAVATPEELNETMDFSLKKYKLENHIFVSVTYDLNSLNNRGLRTKTLDIIKKSSL